MPYQRSDRSVLGPLVAVRADLFPAKVSRGGVVVWDPVKVIVGLDVMWVYEVSGSGGVLVGEFGIDDLWGDGVSGYVVVSGGVEFGVVRSGHCGCGVNRSWRPFDYRLVMTPLRRGG